MSGKRLYVAMVGLRSPWGTEGGVEAHVAALAPRLVERGAHVTVYCRERYNPHGNCYREGVRLADAPTLYSRSLEAFVHTAICAPRACLRHRIVHFHACGPALFTPVPRALGRSTVVTLHGKDWTRDKWGAAARALLRAGAESGIRSSNGVICVSEELLGWARERRQDAERIPNGVDAHEHVAWDPRIFPMLKPKQYLLFLGRLVPEKGLDNLVAAATRARLPMPVVITGGSAYTPSFVAHLRRTVPEEQVTLTGPRFGLEKRMLLSHARAFVLPSRVEGMPVALLEAMAAGLPTITTNIPANAEVTGGLGWSVPVDDPPALARALTAVVSSSQAQLDEIGAAGRARVLSRFGWDSAADRTMAMYEQVIRSASDETPT